MDKQKLYVPANITIRSEFFKGFGNREMAITGIAAAIGLVIGIIIFMTGGNIVASVFTLFIIVGACITLVTKYDNNLSMVDHLLIIMRYANSQQKFYYKHRKERREKGIGYCKIKKDE